MSKQIPFLLEIGCEELPPKSLLTLAQSLSNHLKNEFEKIDIPVENKTDFATPRRLAVKLDNLPITIPAKEQTRKGPQAKNAFDAKGAPTKATIGFAQSCKVDIKDLESREDGYLYALVKIPAQKVIDLLPKMVEAAIKQLPIPKPMRWGTHQTEFVRPVHWIVMMFGEEVVNATILGKKASNISYGHRFHHPEAIEITSPETYETQCEKAYVRVDFKKRRKMICEQIEKCAVKVGTAEIDPELLDEVTSIVEWPVALAGSFDERFLVVPPEAIMTAMKQHQRCFPIFNRAGKLLPQFFTVSNIESKNPEEVIKGNERVIRARLSDAEFFYQADIKHSLMSFADKLSSVVFQRKLGTMAEKTQRITALATYIAKHLGEKNNHTQQASVLAKADLLTAMVGEFPELQGIMGCYYALSSGEAPEVAIAIKEHYLPKFAGDSLPSTLAGSAISLADKIDTIIGIFGINQPPTGDKDPFALRRAALGILRIIIEKKLPLDLTTLFQHAENLYKNLENSDAVKQSVDFILDRLRTWYSEKGVSAEVFASVYARRPTNPLDFHQRIQAVQFFQSLPEAKSLAAANKRVSNMLKKSGNGTTLPAINVDLLQDPAERGLAEIITEKQAEILMFSQSSDYQSALKSLAELQSPVDLFFDNVLVMTENKALQANRLVLLHHLRELFLQIADISYL